MIRSRKIWYAVLVLLPFHAFCKGNFKPAAYTGELSNEQVTIVIDNAEAGKLNGKMIDSQGTYLFTANYAADSISSGQVDLQLITLGFNGRLLGNNQLRLNFLTADESTRLFTAVFTEQGNHSGTSVDPARSGLNAVAPSQQLGTSNQRDKNVIGSWSSTKTETSGWGTSLSMLSYEVVDVFYPDGSYGTGKGDMKTVSSSAWGYDENIYIEKVPNTTWRTEGNTIIFEYLTENGLQQDQATYQINGNKMIVTNRENGNQTVFTRRK